MWLPAHCHFQLFRGPPELHIGPRIFVRVRFGVVSGGIANTTGIADDVVWRTHVYAAGLGAWTLEPAIEQLDATAGFRRP